MYKIFSRSKISNPFPGKLLPKSLIPKVSSYRKKILEDVGATCPNNIAHDRRVGTPVFGPFQESNVVYRNLIIYLFKASNFMLNAYIQSRHVVL